jgi:hypothetical protein
MKYDASLWFALVMKDFSFAERQGLNVILGLGIIGLGITSTYNYTP